MLKLLRTLKMVVFMVVKNDRVDVSLQQRRTHGDVFFADFKVSITGLSKNDFFFYFFTCFILFEKLF